MPVLDEIAEEYRDRLRVVKVNVEQEPQIALQLGEEIRKYSEHISLQSAFIVIGDQRSYRVSDHLMNWHTAGG